MRLIDADAYLKRVRPRGIADELWTTSETYLSVMRVHSVDAVPVVRCKDCRHFCKHDESVGFCKWSHCLKRTNGYCDDGERKNGDCNETD